MFAGVVELEAALVRASQDKDFGCEVPSAENFKLLKALLPILSLIRKVSEQLSGDERPTMDQALIQIFLLRSLIIKNLVAARAAKDGSGQVEFLAALLEQLDQRFITCGGECHHYRLGHLLHPFHKGLLLKRVPTPVFDETVQELVSEHPTTAVYRQKSLENASQAHEKTLVQADEVMDDNEDVAALLLELHKDVLTQQQQDAAEATTPPIRTELDSYMKRTILDPNVDVLAWWKDNESVYPILASVARGVFCHPASSASSERAFSQAGLTLTSKRQRMKVTTLEKLCFVNQNFKLLAPMVVNWNTGPEEEEEVVEEEEETEETEKEILDASQLESSVPPWLGFLERSRKRSASPVVINLDSAPPSGTSTPRPKKHKGEGKSSKKKKPTDSQASQSLLGDDESDDLVELGSGNESN